MMIMSLFIHVVYDLIRYYYRYVEQEKVLK